MGWPVIRPPPLRTDGSNAFARYSMQVRVPAIARDVMAQNPDFPLGVRRAIEQLARDIESDSPLPPPQAPAPDVQAWEADYADHSESSKTWLEADWFYAELAFYRELAQRCRFWETGRDPFTRAKEAELQGERPWARVVAALGGHDRSAASRPKRIASLLEQSLWGNRVDLSYAVAAERAHAHDGDLLVDDRDVAVPLLVRAGARVEVAADNTGTELALDLALVDALLEDESARVRIHVKFQPVFVSDATPRDVWRLLERMRERGGDLGGLADRLVAAFDAERLSLAPDPFWSGPRFLWNAPSHIRGALAEATIALFKGDANYRRVVGDAPWPPETPMADASAYVPCPALCLRTMKSDSVVGLPPGLAERLDASDPRWRIDGRRGVIQCRP
jgi:hypothetical protein